MGECPLPEATRAAMRATENIFLQVWSCCRGWKGLREKTDFQKVKNPFLLYFEGCIALLTKKTFFDDDPLVAAALACLKMTVAYEIVELISRCQKRGLIAVCESVRRMVECSASI